MKIIKRDGRIVEYNREKIEIAIEKANKEVPEKERATKKEINEIIEYIEGLGKKRILVEDIQDIIEEKLMEIDRYKLAKRYIVYRYTRALVRKSNTTDESILGLIRNGNNTQGNVSNRNLSLASTQRDYIAGEVSKDLTNRLLLPEKIVKAHQDGILEFHDSDYFVQPIFNSCIVNIGDMLDNGTVINGKMIESPKSFQVACIIMTQIIAVVASNQYGGQSIDVSHLGKYLRKSYNKYRKELEEEYKGKLSESTMEGLAKERLKHELEAGVQTIQYQIDTLMTTSGRTPFVTLFLYLNSKDPYIKENAMIIEEILKQRIQGMKNENGEYVTTTSPKLVYVLDENNSLKGGEYDYLTELAIECTKKRLYPDYISAKIMREIYEGNVFSPMGCRNFLSPWKDEKGNYKFEGRFNQGVVTINLPQIAILANKDEDKFWKLLDERLDLCREALMCRHYALLGVKSNVSPIHWQYGAISRLKKDETIDNLLYRGYSTISLGYTGIYEMTKLMKNVSQVEQEGRNFAIKVMKHLKETVDSWKKETNIGFTLYGTPEESLDNRFPKVDKEKFGIIKDITDKGYYTNSYHIDSKEDIDIFEKMKIESEFQKISTGGAMSYINVTEENSSSEKLKKIIKFIYENIQYAEMKVECPKDNGFEGKIFINEDNELEIKRKKLEKF